MNGMMSLLRTDMLILHALIIQHVSPVTMVHALPDQLTQVEWEFSMRNESSDGRDLFLHQKTLEIEKDIT